MECLAIIFERCRATAGDVTTRPNYRLGKLVYSGAN